jgi:hypothetical protein
MTCKKVKLEESGSIIFNFYSAEGKLSYKLVIQMYKHLICQAKVESVTLEKVA